MEFAQIVFHCLEEGVIVPMPMNGVKREDGPSDVNILDVLPSKNTMSVLE